MSVRDSLQTLADDGVVVRRRRQRGFVDLDVASARIDQFLYLLVHEVREVVGQRLLVVVGLVERPTRQRVRARDGDLDRAFGHLAGELVLVDEPRVVVLDFGDDAGLVEVVVSPHLHRAVELVARDAVGEVLDHLVAPHLAVHDDVQSGAFVFLGDETRGVVLCLFPRVLVKSASGSS